MLPRRLLRPRQRIPALKPASAAPALASRTAPLPAPAAHHPARPHPARAFATSPNRMVLSPPPDRSARTPAAADGVPKSDVPVFADLPAFRAWRAQARAAGRSVGFVPTMGALHAGHLGLVRRSLEENDLTVLSIFVNPAQFAPHEDLATYPRTLAADLAALATVSHTTPGTATAPPTVRRPSAVFLPAVADMYPSGITQDVAAQRGAFVEVKGFGHQMEGASRPLFFRGVATVVLKLFNAVEPDRAYFGQKDIQQALLLRRLTRDLLLAHPAPERLHIVPTARDPASGLALSSRNAYLTPAERPHAPTLYAALRAAATAWEGGRPKAECVALARELVEAARARAAADGVEMRLDYVELNDSESFEVLGDAARAAHGAGAPVIASGALWVGRTRLIDNVLLNEGGRILAA